MTEYPGRGAWTTKGKDNGSKYFVYLSGKPLDGHRRSDGSFATFNHEAVNLGVKAIQKSINGVGYTPTLTADGVLGSATDKGIRWFQKRVGLSDDGAVGQDTCRALWHSLVSHQEQVRSLPQHILWGIVKHESALDPAAVGASTPDDRGLVQFNTALGSVTIAEAHDPLIALPKAGARLQNALSKYAGKTAALQLHCTIASWNAPAWADKWFHDGEPPNDQIRAYVDNVLTQAKTF